MMKNTETLHYKGGMGKMISITITDAIESWKKDTSRMEQGLWVSKDSFKALDDALKDKGIDPLNYEVKASEEAPKQISYKTRKSYTQSIDEAGDINNLLRDNGNSASICNG